MEKVQVARITKIGKRILEIGFLIAVIVIAGRQYSKYKTESREQYVLEQAATCPSLLSIARSARDTLIVMKNKEMCTQYMLDHLE